MLLSLAFSTYNIWDQGIEVEKRVYEKLKYLINQAPLQLPENY